MIDDNQYTPIPGSPAAAKARRHLARQAAEWTPEAEQELANLERLEGLGQQNVQTASASLRNDAKPLRNSS